MLIESSLVEHWYNDHWHKWMHKQLKHEILDVHCVAEMVLLAVRLLLAVERYFLFESAKFVENETGTQPNWAKKLNYQHCFDGKDRINLVPVSAIYLSDIKVPLYWIMDVKNDK